MLELKDKIPFDISEFGMEVPEVPDHYQALVAEWGGNTEGIPNVRIVRGTDPTIVDWCAGEWIPRYSFPETETVEYAIWHKPDGTKKIITPAEAKVLQSSNKLNGIILPVTERKVRDWLIPRYFVEVYRGPEYYGTKRAWDKVRMDIDIDGKDVDLMGEYPENGQYDTWFCIEDVETDHNGDIIYSRFRGLDDEVLEVIRENIQIAKTTTLSEQFAMETQAAADKKKNKEDKFKQTITEALEDRIDRIVDTPSTARIK